MTYCLLFRTQYVLYVTCGTYSTSVFYILYIYNDGDTEYMFYKSYAWICPVAACICPVAAWIWPVAARRERQVYVTVYWFILVLI